MNKTPITTLCTLAAALFVVLPGQSSAASLQEIKDRGYIRVAVANEIPYGYMDLDGKAKGIGPDVAKQVMNQLGIPEIKWVTTNFGSLIPGLRANRYDMVAAEMAILPQRCKQVLFSEPNSSYGEGLLVAKGNPDDLHSFESFVKSDKKIAIMAGADQLEMLQALGVPADRMITISNNADAISTVSTGRASAYAATSLTVGELAGKSSKVEAAQNFTDPIVKGVPVRSWGGFTFAPDSEALRNAVNTEMAKFKKTPDWEKTMAQYGFSPDDVKGSFSKSTEQLCAE